MGINNHIVPSDIVVTNDETQLYNVHPDKVSSEIRLRDDDDRLVCNLAENESMFVIAVQPAGSAGQGCAFYVMTLAPVRLGWVMNHSVRGVITMFEPSVSKLPPAIDWNTYGSWRLKEQCDPRI